MEDFEEAAVAAAAAEQRLVSFKMTAAPVKSSELPTATLNLRIRGNLVGKSRMTYPTHPASRWTLQ